MSPADAKKGLGRGLSSLLGASTNPATASPSESPRAARLIAVAKIRPGAFQPRRHFDETALADLTA